MRPGKEQAMGEIRKNRLSGEWVIYAPQRGKRPRQHRAEEDAGRERQQEQNGCPFCPGNEDALPGILMELPPPEQASWQIRVVPNKYPALSSDQEPRRSQTDMSIRLSGYGRQEVIIEHPRHDLDPASMAEIEVARLVEAYHRRYVAALEDPNINLVLVFRNHGSKAGTSLLHPHSQLIASAVVPAHARRREQIAQSYFDDWGRCLLCDLLEQELREGRRILVDSPLFAAFVPFAAEVPFEVWIVPRSHRADFASITEEEKPALALVLRDTLSRLREKLGNPDYNYLIHSSVRYRAGEPHLHWWLQVRPRLVTPAGFEIGSGMRINPTVPEDNAGLLR
jgi:UDPglucose--hexose-1-phosphate uridylyltransferase